MSEQAEYMDKLYREAVAVVIEHQKPSTSFVQRKLQIGYNTAAALMIRMQAEKIVGEPNFAGRREILIGRATLERGS